MQASEAARQKSGDRTGDSYIASRPAVPGYSPAFLERKDPAASVHRNCDANSIACHSQDSSHGAVPVRQHDNRPRRSRLDPTHQRRLRSDQARVPRMPMFSSRLTLPIDVRRKPRPACTEIEAEPDILGTVASLSHPPRAGINVCCSDFLPRSGPTTIGQYRP